MAKTITLDSLIGGYGPRWEQGILTEHLYLAESLGLTLVTETDGTATIEGTPVVCSEVIGIYTEDGTITGRCGEPAILNACGDWIWCEGHDRADWGKECEHGMSLALCSGPMHW